MQQDIKRAAASMLAFLIAAMTTQAQLADVKPLPSIEKATNSAFVTRSGSKLLVNGKVFRFAGANADYLVLANDEFAHLGEKTGSATNSYYPSKLMIDDAFNTVVKMNGTVVRVWSAGCQGTALSIEPELGKFNERALQQLDYVIFSANRHGLRLILPFCDNWDFYVGGVKQFSKWRGGKNFYSDPDCKADYKAYVATLVNRKNSITGVCYKDDPTILCWETGNELEPPLEWESEMAAYIKSIDRNHLTLMTRNNINILDQKWFSIPDVDIYQAHYYRVHGPALYWAATKHAAAATSADKVFIIGEYGWDGRNFTLEQLKESLREVEKNPAISGDLYWSLRGRKDDGDFMAVPGAGGEWWALYYPGRTSSTLNKAADMKARVRILSKHAAVMTK